MGSALPTSAWQPPSAPATQAEVVRLSPMAAAQKSASMMVSSLASRCSASAKTHPGTMPEEPAVGAATMTPMDALRSSTAMALAVAAVWTSPKRERRVFSEAVATRCASPPRNPPREGVGFARGALVSSRMTSRVRAMEARARFSPMRRCSRSSMTAPMLILRSRQASRS